MRLEGEAEAEFWKFMALKKVGTTIKIPRRRFLGTSPEVEQAVREIIEENLNGYIEESINFEIRKKLYELLCRELKEIGGGGVIKHIDLWNHNVEFIEQEENWERPAVFVEFCPIRWNAIVNGVEYRAEPEVKLHIVTDWAGAASEGSEFHAEALEVFDLPELIHERLTCLEGETFKAFDLVESQTNHNHEEVVESIEVYSCVAVKRLD